VGLKLELIQGLRRYPHQVQLKYICMLLQPGGVSVYVTKICENILFKSNLSFQMWSPHWLFVYIIQRTIYQVL